MDFAQLEQLQQRQKQRHDFFLRRRSAERFLKAQAAAAGHALKQRQHALLHIMLVAVNIARRVVVRLRGIIRSGLARPDAQERFRQPLQRQADKLRFLRRQRVFLRQLREQVRRRPLELLHGGRGLAEALVFLQTADQRFLRILLALLDARRTRQHRAGFDFQQRSRHDQKVRRVVHIKVRRIAYRINILVGNLADENILDVDFSLLIRNSSKSSGPSKSLS